MGRIFIDGFESGNLGLWSLTALMSVTAAQAGMDGAYNASFTSPNGYIERSIPTKSEIYVGFRYRINSAGASPILSFKKGTTVIANFQIDINQYIKVVRGISSGTILATGPALTLGQVYKIEVRFKPDDTTGIFQVKVDGSMAIDFSGDTTEGNTDMDIVRFGFNGTYNSFNGYVDNVVVDDTAWPGDTRIAAVLPTGAGNSSQWTPSTGNNYACVDEVPPSDADYITTNTVGNKDTYAAGDLPSDASSVKCVQFAARAQKEGAATPQNLAFVIRTGGADYEGSGIALPTTFNEHVRDLWVNNPATSQAFTPSEVNGMEIGIKAVA